MSLSDRMNKARGIEPQEGPVMGNLEEPLREENAVIPHSNLQPIESSEPIRFTPSVTVSTESQVPRSVLERSRAPKHQLTPEQIRFHQLKARVHALLVESLQNVESADREMVVAKIQEVLAEVLAQSSVPVSRNDRLRLNQSLINDILGLGPLEELLKDPDVSDILVNGAHQIYIERHGQKLEQSSVVFDDEKQLLQVIDKIVSSVGRRVDESSPMCDARLQDGSRVNVIIAPLVLTGPTVTIRKFSREKLGIKDLVGYETLTKTMGTFLESCVHARLNVIVAGGSGCGKTTTLNVLSSFIPEDERIITIEDAAELQLNQDHVVTLESRPANVEGRGKISIRDLVVNCLRMRPDRIVVGECRGAEALDMLQAMNTGHDGSLTTIHANTPQDTMSRLETLVLMSGAQLPSRAIRDQIASAINIVVQQNRMRDGTRKITNISEVIGLAEDGRIAIQEIFSFHQTGISQEGKIEGSFLPSGLIPQCMKLLVESGEDVPISLFERPNLDAQEPPQLQVVS